jgi:alkaline phosphatase
MTTNNMFRFSKRVILVFLSGSIILSLFLLHSCGQNIQERHKAKYVFLFIGDGMGLAQASSAEAYLGAKQGIIGFSKLTLSTFPVVSFCTTFSQNNFYTGSAAAGTALATGYKTSNGTVSMDPSHRDTLKTIAEMARDAGMKVGIITSVSIDHATPAVFYAHQPSRTNYHAIAIDLVNSGFNFFGGGGFLEPRSKNKADTVDVLDLARMRGYSIIKDKSAFERLDNHTPKVIVTDPHLVYGQSMPYAIDANEQDMTLAQITRKAIEMLDNPKGFFMMVEGGKIDWVCHANDAASEVAEVIAFDEAVKEAVAFYKQHPGETLIIVTADHETGGMSMGTTAGEGSATFALLGEQKMSIDAFSELIKEFREDHVVAKPDFNEMLGIIKSDFGLGNEKLKLSGPDLDQLKKAFELSMTDPRLRVDTDEMYSLYGEKEPLAVTVIKMLAAKAGIGWTTFDHTALPVPLHALGTGQELFTGYRDNTDVAKGIMKAMGLE